MDFESDVLNPARNRATIFDTASVYSERQGAVRHVVLGCGFFSPSHGRAGVCLVVSGMASVGTVHTGWGVLQ
ncbi:hypothetical protein G1C97_0449 [Bifidobacterium sp. DSM 109959]|uniref:Uncharacterized protein n=1 Tax=Bifidobacterium olomucense TaxID=2675324 RepID=A0A7Y0HUT3_9BIFI|nr:hypothetical protein [Bifidobacterium sp. DSM 109959]